MPSSSDLEKMEAIETTEAVLQDEPTRGAESSPAVPGMGGEGEGEDERLTENPEPSTENPDEDQPEEGSGGGEGRMEEKGEGEEEKTPVREEPRRSIEKEVGITEYASDHVGFFGIIKQRFSDFVVNEVNSAGEIICLTEQMVPHEPVELPTEPAELPPELTPEKIKELNKLAGVREPLRLPRIPPPSQAAQESGEAEGEAKEAGGDSAVGGKEAKESQDAPTAEVEREPGTSMADETEEVEEERGREKEDEDTSMVEEREKDDERVDPEIKEEEEEEEDEDEEEEEEEEEEPMQQGGEEEASMKSGKLDEGDGSEESGQQGDAKDGDQKGKENGERVLTRTPVKARPNEVLINVHNTNKEGRTAIHRAVKAKYPTMDSVYRELPDGCRYIVVRKKKASALRREKSPWPKAQMYTTFVLHKENVDTMEAINHLAWKIRVKPNNFGYAGTKDKRAKTSQLVSVSRVPPNKLWNATKYNKLIQLGNFRFRPTPQKLGQLRGNHFRIVLREVKGSDEVVNSALDALRSQGFINYYGSQRFGTTSIPTHAIGKELLKSNWQQAINLILSPRENDIRHLNRCRSTWQKTGDAESALRALPKGYETTVEAQLLTGLVQLNRNDLVGALARIPRNARLLYLHAYQSYVWNIVVSQRIQKYGLKVLPGDIVRLKNQAEVEEELPVMQPLDSQGSSGEGEKVGTHWWNEEVTKAVKEKKEAYALKMQTEGLSEEEKKDRQRRYQEAKQKAKKVVRESKRRSEEELKKYWARLETLPPQALEEETNDGNGSDAENLDSEGKVEVEGEEVTKKSPNLHFLTEEEAQETDISEVLIPLPGYNVEYPKNEMKDWYEELLQGDGLSFDSFKHRVKMYSVGGMYRRLLVRPSNVSGSICYYKDPLKALIQSDLDKLRSIEVKDNILTEGPYKGVIVEMTLPASSYATVALRELLKMETSSQFQASLSSEEHFTTLRDMDFSSRRGRNTRGKGAREKPGLWRLPNQGPSQGQGQGWGQSQSQGWGQSQSQGWGQSQSQGWGQSQSQGWGQSQSQGWGQGWSQGQGQGQGQSQGYYSTWRMLGDGGPWHQGRGRGERSGFRGGVRGGHDTGWGSGRGGWRGRGDKRPRRGGESWNAKRGRF